MAALGRVPQSDKSNWVSSTPKAPWEVDPTVASIITCRLVRVSFHENSFFFSLSMSIFKI